MHRRDGHVPAQGQPWERSPTIGENVGAVAMVVPTYSVLGGRGYFPPPEYTVHSIFVAVYDGAMEIIPLMEYPIPFFALRLQRREGAHVPRF